MVDELVLRLDRAGYAGFTPAHHVVFENLDPGGTRLTELASRAEMSHQSMSELVGVLEQRGYLERRPDPSDGRARLVSPTPAGRQLLRRALLEISAIEDQWVERLAVAGLEGDVRVALIHGVTRRFN